MSDYLTLLRPLIEHSQAVHFVYDLTHSKIVYVSDAYERLVGDPVQHVQEDLPLWLTRIHPDDQRYIRQQLAQTPPGQLLENVEMRVASPNDRTQWLCLTACRVQPTPEQQYLSGNVRDITAEKVQMINSEKFNTKKNATLEILAHDLANPLVVLQQLTGFLAQGIKSHLTPELQQIVHLMERTCTDGMSLIHDFVDNEFLESSNVQLKLERTNLVPWLGTLLEEYQRAERRIHLQFAYVAPPEPIYAPIDLNKFQQVINNLISNAIKFTPDGGQITVVLEQQPGQVLVMVQDNGIGIAEAQQLVLFERFTPARRPGLRGEKTTGLGMSIIKTIVELHQGRIWFDSAEGKGSTFYITVPVFNA
ncbi:PAS domain-containing sensor histidine kinase [Hymenobacter aquaticus]|uniref:histidine kinase n=1 Tax=Hymenobacter aquaticus TaxID=1867101 RepID=A0A4Z0Q2U7_9BACT|nr:PAS domain-containing sensor histidine kinase [Hymenobacter aquaticus]TGE24350.1 PAS domain-containing sensor histidine kinase [Hymenobacter aquaticus]